VNGRLAKVFGLTGPDGRPGIRLGPGERFRVDLANEAGTKMEEAPGTLGAPGTGMSGMDMSQPGGMHMDLNDVRYDAFLANDRTLADPEVVRLERGGRVRLRVINGASSSQFWIDFGDLVGRVVATDGQPCIRLRAAASPLQWPSALTF
jgi:FtsP/CotA-like multicopper oxidase with cupredoxin domain